MPSSGDTIDQLIFIFFYQLSSLTYAFLETCKKTNKATAKEPSGPVSEPFNETKLK
jgi:hypothetical protein